MVIMAEEKEKTNALGDGDVEMNEEEAVKEQLTSNDPSKVKYVNNDLLRKNGEAKVDIENIQLQMGMGKEELMKYANEPFWIRTRMILFVLFWVAWLAMLVGAVVIIVLTPRCPPPPELDWWQKSVFYHIYVPSFKDSDGDGVGDLKGIESKLDYFKDDLGVETLLLSPIYQSPMKDNGYDISNYYEINPTFGTMQDFEDLVHELKNKDMKLVIDFVPNHSSDQHLWFKESIKSTEPYKDYYIWADGKDGKPPNNWISVFGNSAWTYNEERGQYYFHQFSPEQPDLNLRNSLIREELENVLEFWLGKNVDGFRIDAIPHLFESKELLDEPVNENTTAKENTYEYLDHIYTKSQPEIFDILGDWRNLVNNYTNNTGSHRVLIAEAYDTVNNTMKYYGSEKKLLADFPFNFNLLALRKDSTARELLNCIESWTDSMPSWGWPNWVLGNHDVQRLTSRVGRDMIDGIHMAILLNNGTPISYYGDELGMEDATVLPTELTDKANPDNPRDAYRAPMQWVNDTSAGFTNGTSPWIPVQPDYTYLNVEDEKRNLRSHLNVYRNLVKLRSQPAIRFGIIAYPLVTDDIFSMLRIRKGAPGYLVVFNMGVNSTSVDVTKGHKNLPGSAILEIRSHNILTGDLAKPGQIKVHLNKVQLGPKESVVLSFVPKFED